MEMEEEKFYSVTLADGTKLENLELNGNNYISKKPIDQSLFDYNLDRVTISDGETEEIYQDMALIHVKELPGGLYMFALRNLSQDELGKAKLRADIDYLYMMTETDIM